MSYEVLIRGVALMRIVDEWLFNPGMVCIPSMLSYDLLSPGRLYIDCFVSCQS